MVRLGPDATVEDVCARLDEDGFCIVERYLSPDDIEAKRADLARVLGAIPTGRNEFEGFSTQRIYALFAKTRSFDAQATDPLVCAACEHVLGVPKQIVAALPLQLQELLGYNVVGLLGNVDGRHPLKYLDDRREVRDGVIAP